MMLKLQTDLEGERAVFGAIQDLLEPHGYDLGGNWDFDRGSFDTILWRQGGETIYLRIPFHVVDGELDQYDASIEFQTPYVIKHVVNIGLDKNESALLTVAGINQFQKPLDTDGQIKRKNKWEEAGKQKVEQIINYVYELQ